MNVYKHRAVSRIIRLFVFDTANELGSNSNNSNISETASAAVTETARSHMSNETVAHLLNTLHSLLDESACDYARPNRYNATIASF
jgi:hypothetical protein